MDVRELNAYFSFYFKNYIRSHRYVRELVLILIFNIFFWGFLYGDQPENAVWTVFGVLSLLLNMTTVPSLFYLEKGNSLSFGLIRPAGRLYYLFSKILLILLIDLFWVLLFSLLYGLRFMDGNYFVLFLPRFLLIALLQILSISILTLTFTAKPAIAWLLLILIVFGGILNKSALFPWESLHKSYTLFTFLLPPILEILFTATTLQFPLWRSMFLLVCLVQITLYLWLNTRLILRKDFL